MSENGINERSIGLASMHSDGTLVLRLATNDTDLGSATLYIFPDDANYESTVAQLGGIQPGEIKPVPATANPRELQP